MKIALIALLFLATTAYAIEQYESFPYNTGDELVASIVVKDIDGDGKLEIIAAPQNRIVKVIDHKGTLKWEGVGGRVQYDTGRVPLLSDLTGDSKLEIISYGNLGWSDATFYIWDSSGNKIKEFWVGKYIVISSPSITQQGIILTGAAPGRAFSAINEGTGVHAFDSQGNKLWYRELGRSVNFKASIPVADIDGDGIDEAVILTQDINSGTPTDGKAWLIKAERAQGKILWSKELGGDARGAAVADINGDGSKEVIVVSSGGTYILDKTGAVLYYFKIQGTSVPSIGDLDNDGINEAVIPSWKDGKIYVISKGILKEFPAESVSSNLALGDLNNDGKLEIAAGDLDGNVYVWDYQGKLIEKTNAAQRYQYFTSTVIADLDGDGSKEIILGNRNGNIHVFKTKNPVPPKAVISSPLNGSVHQLDSPVEFISSSTDDGTIVSYKWESSIDGILGEDQAFSKTLSAGWHNVTLTVKDNDGLSNSTSVAIKINKPPEALIESPADWTIYRQRDTAIFSGTGKDEDGYVTSYQWVSDIDGIIGNSAGISYNLSEGLHNITLIVKDNDGAESSKTIRVNQTGYDVALDLKQKQVMGEKSLLSSNKPVYKLGSMVPIKFRVYESGVAVVDTGVTVTVTDENGTAVFNARYGNGSKAVRIDEGRYIANFKSNKNDLSGIYKIEIKFDSQRKNQDFSESIYLLGQKSTYFAGRAVSLKSVKQGNAFTYEWKLGSVVLSNGEELNWVPSEAGIYNIQLFITQNKKMETEGYSIVINAEADSNGDDAINVLDLSLAGLNWGRKLQDNDFDDSVDLNGDGVIDIFDAVKIGKKWS